ncbi:MAG: hypothetical protein ACPGLV_18235, partial [Bacteroidia bacterium]
SASLKDSIKEEEALDYLKSQIGEHSKLFVCNTRFHFLDQFMLFIDRCGIDKFVCNNKKLNSFFESCGLSYAENFNDISKNTMSVFMADYFEPKGLFAAFNYNGFTAEALKRTQHIAIVCFKDSLVKNSKHLFERINNRIGENDLKSVQLVNIAEIESFAESSEKVSFIISNR